MAHVTIYTSANCPGCSSAKRFFQERGVHYTEHNISENLDKAQELIDKTGQMSVPVIEIDGEYIIGFDKRRLSTSL
ncbi:glutaredoxin family protein [Candidatus Acetothermia bacterium]|nr:glutaredoxin family protein [Candidatus Acetothermia bacterium]MBI3642817.1 glutaredoxin family protein [Candidatus Acetothermia bacterium]